LASASSSCASASSSAASAPRRRVPAIGRASTTPFSTRTSISGEEPTSCAAPASMQNMYGDGFTARSAR